MADFRINVVVDPSQAVRGTRRVGAELNRVARTADRLRNLLSRTFAVVGLTAGIGAGISLLANFSQEMSTVAAVTQATATEFAALSEEATKLGVNTRFTATQAAEGMSFLARAGFEADEVLASIGDTLLLAQAGSLGLGRAADIASNVLKAFRLEVEESARVVDVLALAANSSNTTVEQLGQAMKFVAPVAAGVSVELEETAAAIGALSNAGLQATLAGTGLRRVISELESPTEKTKKLLFDMGLSADSVKISSVGLTTALTRLRDSGIDTSLALELFGDRGGPAFEVLSNSIPDIIKMTEAFEGADGTAKRIAATMDRNLNGALLRLRSAFEGLVLATGEQGATSALTGFVESLTKGLRALAANGDTVVSTFQTLSIVLGVRFAQKALPAAIAGVKRLTIAMLANPATAMAAAFTVLIAVMVGFRHEIQLSGDSVATLGDFFSVAVDRISDALDILLKNVGVVFEAIAQTFGGTFDGFELSFQNAFLAVAAVLDTSQGIFVGFVRSIQASFSALPAAIGEATIASINALITQVETGFDGVFALGATVGTFFTTIAFAVSTSINTLAQASTQLLAGNLSEAGKLTQEAGKLLAENLGGAFSNSGTVLVANLKKFQEQELLPRLNNSFAGAGEKLGESVSDGFLEGFQASTGATDLVLGVIADAEEKAQRRQIDRSKVAEADAIERAKKTARTTAQAVQDELARIQPPEIATFGVEDVLRGLAEEAALLKFVGREREVQSELLQIENDLRKEGIELSAAERGNLQERIESLQALNEQGRILEELRGPQEDLLARQAAANALFNQGKISLQEFNQVMRDAALAAAEAGTSIGDGLTVGLIRIQDQINDLSGLAESTLTNAFSGAEDALTSFITTGKANFSGLVDSIIADVGRLLARQAIGGLLGLIGGGGGGGGGGLTSLIGGLFGRAEGGPVNPSQPFIVGERGPEIFQPSIGGNIIPAQETASIRSGGASPGPVNVNPQFDVTVNVDKDGNADVQITEKTFETRAAEQGVLGILQRNPRQLRNITGS